MKTTLLSLGLPLTLLVGVGCLASDEPGSDQPGGKADGSGILITEADDGKTFDVQVGQEITLELRVEDPNQYQWQVIKSNKAFGSPYSDEMDDSGVQRMIWTTIRPPSVELVGLHTVDLALVSVTDPLDSTTTFSFNVNVVQPILITGDDDGKTIDVAVGQYVTVELPVDVTSQYRWKVVEADKSFGQPYFNEAYGWGVHRMIWSTERPPSISIIGSHTVKIELLSTTNPSNPPLLTFSFTVDIQ